VIRCSREAKHFLDFLENRMNVFMNVMMKNAATMKPEELKELLKNRGDKQGNRNVGRDVLLGALRNYAQTAVDFEKLASTLTFEGAKAELKALGKVPPKMKIGELRELVKQAAKEAEQGEEIEQAERAAKEAAAAAEQMAMEVQAEQEAQAEQAAQAEQEGQAPTANKNKKKRKGESVEAALSPVKVTKKEAQQMFHREKKKGPTSRQRYVSDHSLFTAEKYRIKKMGAKTAGKTHRLESGQNAYLLRPGLGEIVEIGFRVALGEKEEKNLTWYALAHVMSTAANRQVHPGVKEAAQEAWMPSTTIAEQQQRDATSAAFRAGVQQHLQQDGSESDSSGSESDTDGSDSDV